MEIININEKGITTSNGAYLIGRVLERPVFDHKVYGRAYYMIVLGILRKSGYEDKIRLLVSEKLLGGRSPKEGEMLEICGQVRTYNRDENGRNKLEVVVFVKSFKYLRTGNIYKNEIELEGFICKPPIKRRTPLGRDICDLMIAVNREHNKSDYIPAIAWGNNASWCEYLDVGDRVIVEGRLQSRDYQKVTEGSIRVTKTAYEVSVVSLEAKPL